MELEFETIAWTREFESPFHRKAASGYGENMEILRGFARSLHSTKLDMLVRVSFDCGQEFEVDDLRCVVIGVDKAESHSDRPNHYVLIIAKVHLPPGQENWERVGVASLKPMHVGDKGVWVNIQ